MPAEQKDREIKRNQTGALTGQEALNTQFLNRPKSLSASVANRSDFEQTRKREPALLVPEGLPERRSMRSVAGIAVGIS